MANTRPPLERLPLDTTHEVRRRYLVRRSHFLTIVAAWIVTVPASALLSALVYVVLDFFFL